MKTLALSFRNGSSRTIEALSYSVGARGIVLMLPGGGMMRFGKEELLRFEEIRSNKSRRAMNPQLPAQSPSSLSLA